MTELPAEVAEARRLLHQVLPAPFSKSRVYARVIKQRNHRRQPRARVAVLALCLAASSSAMAVGYGWVTLRGSDEASDETLPCSTLDPVSRRHKDAVRRQQPTANHDAGNGGDSPRPATSVDGAAAAATDASGVLRSGRQAIAARATPTNDLRRAPLAAVQMPEPPEDSALAQQVRDYHEAVATIGSNPLLALQRLQAFRHKWRQSPINEEVDLREIEALIALARHAEAANAARRFAQRYPASARATEMLRIANQKGPGTGRFD